MPRGAHGRGAARRRRGAAGRPCPAPRAPALAGPGASGLPPPPPSASAAAAGAQAGRPEASPPHLRARARPRSDAAHPAWCERPSGAARPAGLAAPGRLCAPQRLFPASPSPTSAKNRSPAGRAAREGRQGWKTGVPGTPAPSRLRWSFPSFLRTDMARLLPGRDGAPRYSDALGKTCQGRVNSTWKRFKGYSVDSLVCSDTERSLVELLHFPKYLLLETRSGIVGLCFLSVWMQNTERIRSDLSGCATWAVPALKVREKQLGISEGRCQRGARAVRASHAPRPPGAALTRGSDSRGQSSSDLT